MFEASGFGEILIWN